MTGMIKCARVDFTYGKFPSTVWPIAIWGYYNLKPCIPWPLRMAVRSWLARRILRRSDGFWPILERAGQSPPGWSWPDGKQFALVLTHDVESGAGVNPCTDIADLEANMGFRSSFNFVPAGTYLTPPDLRKQLERRGFEVGVHDLRHDGKLYASRKVFRANAERINSYLRAWDATGFRSAFMHHNLEWLQDLDVSYDASTFDVDPFEPQPDGVGTIFPFVVRHRATLRDYVELPYTLVQDSTLFLVLRERTIDIWKRKLDWIAERGGMALLNTHPDYMCFSGSPASRQYSARLYAEFLKYAQDKYGGIYWQALPREVASYAKHQSTTPERLVGSACRQEVGFAKVALSSVIWNAAQTLNTFQATVTEAQIL